ncbi:hypothetical protein KAR91_47905 [Candidatus Pacearchaeota archaeon]|nr:hypothetical protein [Candidatus Pacearchaeota archaeon]
MSTIVTHDLNADDTFVKAIWLGNKTSVIDHLKKMMKEGWRVTIDGLISESEEHGVVIAKPLKVKGSLESTGIGIFRFDNRE